MREANFREHDDTPIARKPFDFEEMNDAKDARSIDAVHLGGCL
jgi:hypothetical protein